jgi:hypothetical protein
MSDKIKVAIKVRRLIDREESDGLVSQWEIKNNSIFQKDGIGKYRESYSFGKLFILLTTCTSGTFLVLKSKE